MYSTPSRPGRNSTSHGHPPPPPMSPLLLSPVGQNAFNLNQQHSAQFLPLPYYHPHMSPMRLMTPTKSSQQAQHHNPLPMHGGVGGGAISTTTTTATGGAGAGRICQPRTPRAEVKQNSIVISRKAFKILMGPNSPISKERRDMIQRDYEYHKNRYPSKSPKQVVLSRKAYQLLFSGRSDYMQQQEELQRQQRARQREDDGGVVNMVDEHSMVESEHDGGDSSDEEEEEEEYDEEEYGDGEGYEFGGRSGFCPSTPTAASGKTGTSTGAFRLSTPTSLKSITRKLSDELKEAKRKGLTGLMNHSLSSLKKSRKTKLRHHHHHYLQRHGTIASITVSDKKASFIANSLVESGHIKLQKSHSSDNVFAIPQTPNRHHQHQQQLQLQLQQQQQEQQQQQQLGQQNQQQGSTPRSSARFSLKLFSPRKSRALVDTPSSSSFPDLEITFKQTLHTPSYLKYFGQYCAKELSSENVDFWKQVQKYAGWRNKVQRLKHAISIFKTFVDVSSPRAINIDQNAIQAIGQRIQNCVNNADMLETLEGLFDSAAASIEIVMVDSFTRFKKSHFYEQMLQEARKSNRFSVSGFTDSGRLPGEPHTTRERTDAVPVHHVIPRSSSWN